MCRGDERPRAGRRRGKPEGRPGREPRARSEKRPGTWRLFAHYVRFNLSAAMEYRVSFLVLVTGMALNNSAFIVFWLILLERVGGSIRGYSFTDVMFLWAISAVGYGLVAVFLGNGSQISRIICSGELDAYLLQPKPILPNLLASRMVVSGWGDLAYGLLLFLFTQPLAPSKIALFLLFSVLLGLILVSLRIIYHSLTFFLGNAESFAETASNVILSFVLYPGSIFEGPVRWVLHSLIPAALMAYIPAELFRSFDLPKMALLIGADGLFVLAAFELFHRGLRVYESGNRMGTRI